MKKKFDKSNKLYDRAISCIPLASQTFSKSAMNFPKGATPLFFKKGKGAYVWDYDNNKYIDYVGGLMPIILGYGDIDVDNAIKDQLGNGIIFSLPSQLEIDLSEKLINLIPSAEMVRFGKNGSDVTSAAIRLSRAYTGRDKVAICGYHGWHDWYIGTTKRNLGVPKDVQNLSNIFNYNDLDSLEDLLKTDLNGFAAVILEPAGAYEPVPGFLEGIRELCNQHGIVLIFDEIVTGFRIDMGGAQKKYGVTPDLSTFGKAMGNGMPISAIVGKREIMKLMEDIFFSGTFGGEALSLAASIATLNKLERLNAPELFKKKGRVVHYQVSKIIEDYGLNEILSVTGADWWPRIVTRSYKDISQIQVTTLLRQELIEKGLFMGGGFNFSIENSKDCIISEMLLNLKESFGMFSDNINCRQPLSRLRGEVIRPVFQVRST